MPDNETPKSSGRGWKVAAVIAVILAALALGVLGSLLFGGGDPAPSSDVRACIPVRDFTQAGKAKRDAGPTCPPKDAKQTIGLVQKTTSGGFTMREVHKGKLGSIVTLHVRTPDRPYIDIAHAQSHAALGQPVRVFTLRVDGRDSVVYMDDPKLGF